MRALSRGGLLTALSLGGFAGALVACGDDSSGAAPGSGTGSPDGSVLADGGLSDATCSSNILGLPPPGQPIADGSSTTTACTTCVNTTCGAQTSDCNSDCKCGPLLTCAFKCITSDGGTQALLGCAATCGGLDLLTNPPANATAFLTCVQSGCSDECGLSGLTMPGQVGGDTDAGARPDTGVDSAAPVDAGSPDTGAVAADASADALAE